MLWYIAAFIAGLVIGVMVGVKWANWAMNELVGSRFGWR